MDFSKILLLLCFDPTKDWPGNISFPLAHIYSDWRDQTMAQPGFEDAMDSLESSAVWGIFSLSWDHLSKAKRRELLFNATNTINRILAEKQALNPVS